MMCLVTIIGSENTVRCYLSVLDRFSPHIRGDTLASAVGSLSKLRADLFDIYDFWRLSIYAAVCARLLATHLD